MDTQEELPVKKKVVKKKVAPSNNGAPKKKAQVKKKSKPSADIIFGKIDSQLFLATDRPSTYSDVIPLDADIAKMLLGWEEETKEVKFGEDFPALLTDLNGNKVRCSHNTKNRPFYRTVADDWMYEVLRRKWKLNGETIVFDKEGECHEGQHRLIGLVLATQEWLLDKERPLDEQLWQDYWDAPPCIDAIIVMGVNGEDMDTAGTGKRRTMEDAFYRTDWLADIKSPTKRLKAAKVLTNAVKLLWHRTAQQLTAKDKYGDAFGPKRPHSEVFDFVAKHPTLVKAVKFILEEDDEREAPEGISQFIPLGYASALMYLMGSATSESDKYDQVLTEKALKWDLWDKAEEFWTDFASNGEATEALRECFVDEKVITPLMSGGYLRDLKIGMIVKAYNLYSDGEEITQDAILIEESLNGDTNQPELAEKPLLGGIDTGG